MRKISERDWNKFLRDLIFQYIYSLQLRAKKKNEQNFWARAVKRWKKFFCSCTFLSWSRSTSIVLYFFFFSYIFITKICFILQKEKECLRASNSPIAIEKKKMSKWYLNFFLFKIIFCYIHARRMNFILN